MHQSLAGIRVVSIEQAVAAPLCSRHLADLGADVIKVERTGCGDFARRYDSMVGGYASHFIWLNHGKRSIALDIKSSEGRQVLEELVRSADVLLSNLGPGAIDRVISYDRLKSINPRIVQCAISAFGTEGPYRDRKSYDALIQGETGVTMNTGEPGRPAKPAVSLADLAGGVYAFGAINAALVERTSTDVGQRIDLALFDVLTEWMMPLLLAYKHTGSTPPPAGTRHATIAPYGPFRSSDGQLVNIAVQNEGQWHRLCAEVLNRPELKSKPRFATNNSRVRNREEVESIVAGEFEKATASSLCELLDAADIPWGMLNDVPDVVAHPQLLERQRWMPTELPDEGRAQVLVPPFLDREDVGRRAVPALGEHTDEVLAELGYSKTHLQELHKSGVLFASQ